MDCSEFLVSELCFPRYAFMKKQVTELMNRGRELIRRDELIHALAKHLNLDLVKLSDDNSNMKTIIVDVIQLAEERVISEDDIIVHAGTVLEDELPQEEWIEFQKSFNVLKGHKIARVKLYQYFSGYTYSNTIYVAKDQIKRKKMRHRKTKICLKQDFSKEVCRTLEVNIFKQLKITYEKLRVLHDKVQKMSNSMNMTFCSQVFDDIENLLEDITGLYQRSQVPEDDRPNFADRERSVSTELLKDFRNISELISRCGYRGSTLYVFVDSKNPEGQLINDIDRVLKTHGICKYSVVSSFINQYAGCSSGSRAEVQPAKNSSSKNYGTLGGYVYVDGKERLGALISRHVARTSYDGRVHISNSVCSVRGKIIPEEFSEREAAADTKSNTFCDAVVAYIDEDDKDNCSFTYFTENRVPVPGMHCNLLSLKRLPVHIAGADTQLGLGKVAIPKCRSVQQPSAYEDNFIYLEDRESDHGPDQKRFCKEGDSGAMVCTHDPDSNGEKVQLISIVMGEVLKEPGLYCTVKLKDALDQIEEEIGETLSLC